MDEGGVTGLVKYCRDRAGDRLRSVVAYDPAGTRVAYRRDDHRNTYTDEQLARLAGSAREIDAVVDDTDVGDAPLGESLAGVYAFEEAYVIHLPSDDESGVVATFDADVGTYLAGFVRDCRERVERAPSADVGDAGDAGNGDR